MAGIRAAETKIGVAVCLKGYEYLPEVEDGSADFRRISALRSPSETGASRDTRACKSARRSTLTTFFYYH